MDSKGYLWLCFIGIVFEILFIMGQTYLEEEEKKPQDPILGGLDVPSVYFASKKDSLFDDPTYAGDTACFKLINKDEIKIMCVCKCDEFRKIKK